MGERVTAIMPVKHFHVEYLRAAVGSILGQRCPDWRLLIVVERGDAEECRRVLGGAVDDARVEISVNQGRKLAGAINSGLRRARTAYVALLLGDDAWSSDAVEVLARYIERYPEVDFFHSARLVMDEKGSVISPVYPSRETFSLDEFKWGSPVKHLLCWRREKALAIGGLDESLNSVGADDYEFPWRMAESGATFKAVRECLYYYRNHCESYRLTTHLPLSTHDREVRRILKKHGVGVWTRMRVMAAKRRGGLGRQCLYRSWIDKWVKEKLGYDARRDWRQEKYR